MPWWHDIVLPLMVALGLKVTGDCLLTGYGIIAAGRPRLLALILVAELLHVPYIIGVTLAGVFGTFEWRGRKTRAMSAP